MIRYIVAAAVLSLSFSSLAQLIPLPPPDAGHDAHSAHRNETSGARATEPGQGAFAAIQEIVSILEADPETDWSKVDIDGLRRHLVDMHRVTLYAKASTSPTDKGVRFSVTGSGAVRASIRRMVGAHAETMNGLDGMIILAEGHPEGAVMTVTAKDLTDRSKLEGLGFFGIMTRGMHHQKHHFMIATGSVPHRQGRDNSRQ